MSTKSFKRRAVSTWGLAMAACAISAPLRIQGQDFSAWSSYVDVTMNTTSAGAGVTGNVAGYPVAVRLGATSIDFAQAKADGSDLRVSKDGAPVPFEIEHFDAAGKKAALWVKLDVQGNNATQKFRIHWGNPAATAAGDSKAVFAAADGFLGVWHLGEDGKTEEGAFKDATEAARHGTGVNVPAGSNAAAVVGMGNTLRNANVEYIQVADATGFYRPTSQLTSSIWGWPDAYNSKWGGCCDGYQCVMSSGEGWAVQREMAGKWETCFNGAACAIGRSADLKKWTHFVVRRNGNSHELFMDGTKASGASGIVNREKYKPLGIGQQTEWVPPASPGERRSWDGILDEMRVMNKAVSNDWIKLDYESQKPAGNFLSFGQIATTVRNPGFASLALPHAFRSAEVLDVSGRVVERFAEPGFVSDVLDRLDGAPRGGGVLVLRMVDRQGAAHSRALAPRLR